MSVPEAAGERGGVLARIKLVNATRRPEDSVSLRVAVLASVLVAVVAVAWQGSASLADAALAFVLLPVGAWVSWRRRRLDNTVIKILLTLGALFALYRFFAQLRSAVTIEDTREPLANLFLAVQILHGFDLPQRRDLGFTLASSLSLVALAATGARGSGFGVVLLAYAVAAGVASAGLQRAAARDEADNVASEHRLAVLAAPDPGGRTGDSRPLQMVAASAGGLLRGSGTAMLAGLLVFLILPRADTGQLVGLPFEGFGTDGVGAAGVVNPGLPYGGSRRAGEEPFNPSAYFGLAEVVDLRTRGELSEELVMRVQADRPRFWRGMVFDRYEDSSWTRSAEDPETVSGIPARLPYGQSPRADYTRVVQTYELVQQTPNLIFAAADPIRVYHAAGSISVWDDGTVTTSAEQEAGILYSVESLVDVSDRDALRRATGTVPDAVRERYLQLPRGLPDRVTELGRDLTSGADTAYAKAEAVQAWLGANVEYSLDPTLQPSGADAVDWFLFEHRRGWCEQIATSMVMLLRASGVPARFATGFAPGLRNPFSGWYEVRVADAHAWVEVWVPGHGWTPFDPTGAVPQAVDPGGEGVQLGVTELFRWIGERVPALPRALGAIRDAATDAPWVVLVLVGGLGGLLAVGARRRTVRRHARAAAAGPFARLERLLGEHGAPRDDWQTPREYVARVRLRRPELPEEPLRTILAVEEARRYDPGARVDEGAADEAVAALATALEESRENVPAGT